MPAKAKNANKTKETRADAAGFVAKVADAGQRADAQTLIALLTKLSGEPAKMWGPSIIGFGRYHYKYESGREGEMCRIGFSPRKGATVLYAGCEEGEKAKFVSKLGKVKTGKGCIYIKKLADVDMKVLEALCKASLTHSKKTYPQG